MKIDTQQRKVITKAVVTINLENSEEIEAMLTVCKLALNDAILKGGSPDNYPIEKEIIISIRESLLNI